MSENENIHSEWDQLVENWRPLFNKWNEVMVRNDLTPNPSHKDLELAERLGEQADAAWEKMKKFQQSKKDGPIC